MTFDQLTNRFGGHIGLAKTLGVGRSTVTTWRLRGGIPDAWKWRILQLARERRIRISVKDLATLQLYPEPHAERVGLLSRKEPA